jgi:hypothetical protein
MKHLRIVWIGMAMLVAVSCIINTGGTGGGSGGLVSDASAGLSGLAHYRAALTRTIKAETAGGPVERSDRLSLAVWRAEKAVFETVNSTDETGAGLLLAAGTVDRAGYLLLGEETGCQVFWDDENIQVDEDALTGYLYPLKSGSASGDETVGGIAVHTFDVNSDSLGVKGVEASGKVWIAADGGYLVKYHLELTGSDALFGSGASGTLSLDYELSEVNTQASVAYPGDCRPVLLDIPAADDAQSLLRMPNRLSYVSASPLEKIQSFYEEFFSGQGWIKKDENTLAEGERDLFFSKEPEGREAMVFLRAEGNTTAVDVTTNDGPPPASPTPGGATPEGGAGSPPSVRIISSLSTLLGDGLTPGALPSFALAVDEVMPTTTGQTVIHVQAEVEGADVHYTMTADGKRTEAILIGEDYYEVIDEKAQPGSVMLSTKWTFWQLDLLTILSGAGMSNPAAQPGTTLEGRPADVYSVESVSLGGEGKDTSFGLLPISITAIHGEVWIDHETGALLKADLEFEANVKEPGATTPSAHGSGELHLAVSRIGQVTVSLP